MRTVRLSELFTKPNRSLIIYHLMYGKQQTKACPMCTAWLDGANGVAHHLAQNVDFAVVAAPSHPNGNHHAHVNSTHRSCPHVRHASAAEFRTERAKTLAPRLNYWAALLWRKFMGTTVLDAGASPAPSLHLYAHCLRGQPGGVALLAINTDQTASHSFELTAAAERYTLSAPWVKNLDDTRVQLNGTELKLGTDDGLPPFTGAPTGSGHVTFAPATISYLAIPMANNASCR